MWRRLGPTVAACVAVTALIAGCNTTTDGRPIAVPTNPTEPTVPTSTSPRPTPTPTTSSPPPTAPPAGNTLPPDDSGYVFIETKSGKTRCQINESEVGCEAEFTSSPTMEGSRANGIIFRADGTNQWVLGNMGAIPTVPIDYQTYHAVGWTIDATEAGTKFTNDRTGHGAFVSVERVDTF